MTGWLDDMSTGNRRAAIGLVAALLAIVAALFVWMPLKEQREALAGRIESQAGTLGWMQEASRRVAAQRDRSAAPAKERDGRSLLALVDATARDSGLSEMLQRAEPAGSDGVRVWLESARFTDVAAWMEQLAGRHGLAVTEYSMERSGDGRVNVRLTVSEAAGS